MEKAADAQSRGSYFEAERLALKALQIARQISDFSRMADVARTLGSARSHRLQAALKAKKVTVWDGPITERVKVKPGCYIIEPPLVGADARRLRIAALQNEVPVAVLCREPLTKLKQWPIVAIGAGATVRTRIDPPKNPEKPSMSWFEGALEALGECAVQSVDPSQPLTRQIDTVLERLDTVPDHTGLHELLEKICHEAARPSDADSEQDAETASASRTKSRT